jgi:hypothetical protein
MTANSPAGDAQGVARSQLSTTRRVLFIAVALAGALAVSVAFLEFAIRLIAPQQPSWLAIYAESPKFPFYVNQSNLDQVIDIGESQFRIVTDANGFRIGEQAAGNNAEATEGVRRVLALGDSFTFGNAVNYEDSFVGLLNGEPTLHVTNTGVGGYGPKQYLGVLQHELDHGRRPDVVLVSIFAGNDVHDCAWNKDLPVLDGVAGGDPTSFKDRVKKNSQLYGLLENIYHTYVSAPPAGEALSSIFDIDAWSESPLAEGERDFRKAMSQIAIVLGRAEIPLVVALISTRQTVEAIRNEVTAPPGGKPDYLLPNRRIATVLTEVGLDPIDSGEVLSRVDTAETYFEFDGHLTPKGHRIYFELIRDRVLLALMPPTRQTETQR